MLHCKPAKSIIKNSRSDWFSKANTSVWAEPCVRWAELKMLSFWAGGISSFLPCAREYRLLRSLTQRGKVYHLQQENSGGHDHQSDKEVNIYSCLKFVDTMNFMRTSLEKLVGNLERPSFEHTGKYFRGEELDLMLRKGVYPYEYMTGAERLCEKSLPPKEEFASLLGSGVISDSEAIITPSHISDEDYRHAQKVFEAFGCENLADCTGLYCKSDVLLLADVFESFINVCLGKYGLDPSH